VNKALTLSIKSCQVVTRYVDINIINKFLSTPHHAIMYTGAN